jgi:hypothetical protein
MMATILHPSATDYPLYGHQPGNTPTPNQTETFPSPWLWWAYVIILVILTCVTISIGIYKFHHQRRIMKEAQRLAGVEAAQRRQAINRNSAANHPSRILSRDPSTSGMVIFQLPFVLLGKVRDIDVELLEDGSSWGINTIMAWVNEIPEDAGADMADLEIQLLRARRYEDLQMERGRRLERPKVTFAPNLPTKWHVPLSINES